MKELLFKASELGVMIRFTPICGAEIRGLGQAVRAKTDTS